MTHLIIRPSPNNRRPTLHSVAVLTDSGEERYIGRVEQTPGGWRTQMADCAPTREAAACKLATTMLLHGPYHVEVLAQRKKVVRPIRCARGRIRRCVVTVQLVRTPA